MKQLFFLGMDDNDTVVNKGDISAATFLQFALEKKLALQPGDKDMVVMHHEMEFEREGKNYRSLSTLIVKGEDDVHTAMAKTVGLPLGIATRLALNGTITSTGLRVPVSKEIYEPVLAELKFNGIEFNETREELP